MAPKRHQTWPTNLEHTRSLTACSRAVVLPTGLRDMEMHSKQKQTRALDQRTKGLPARREQLDVRVVANLIGTIAEIEIQFKLLISCLLQI